MSDRSIKGLKENDKYGGRSRSSNRSQTSGIKRGNGSAMSSKSQKKKRNRDPFQTIFAATSSSAASATGKREDGKR